VRRLYERVAMRRSLRRAGVAVCSRAIATALSERFGDALHGSVGVVPLGVDTSIFYPDPTELAERPVFHLGSSEARDQSVLVVGAYARALRLAPDLPDLVIAGDLGGQADLVVQRAEQAGVRGRVRLLGRVNDDELRQYYSSAVACVQPARYEGFGLQPLEALACGAALIVLDEPAVREVVSDAAHVVVDETEPALAAAIVELWTNEALRAGLHESGPKRAAEFTWLSTAQRLLELLVDVAV
jgi:glycosyltransferase involved in cell wall biosynthesis